MTAREAPHLCVQQCRTTLADANAEIHNRVTVHASHPLNLPDSGAFRQCADNCDLFFFR